MSLKTIRLPMAARASLLAIGATVTDNAERHLIDVVLPDGHNLDGGPMPGFMVIRRDADWACLFSMPISDFKDDVSV